MWTFFWVVLKPVFKIIQVSCYHLILYKEIILLIFKKVN